MNNIINPAVPAWYAVYTHGRAEKKVARELAKHKIVHYLPLYTTLRQWSDRKKKVEEPLIRSYLFVYITEAEYRNVLTTPFVVTIVSFSGRPVPVPDWQIENLKILLGAKISFEHDSHEYGEGEEVRISRGNLEGLRGTIIRVKGQHKLVIRVNALNYSLTIDIDPGFVEPL